MIYITILFVLLMFSRAKPKLNSKLFMLGIFVILLTTCFRSPFIGIDTMGGYYEDYKEVVAGTRLTWMEPAWEVINRISIVLGFGYQGVIAIAGLLTILPVACVLTKVSDNRCLSLAIYYGMYFILYSFNLMRQMIAVSFAFLAIYHYTQKKWMYVALALCVGFLFHKTILFALPLFIFVRLDMRYLTTVAITLGSLLVGIMLPTQAFYSLTGRYSTNLSATDSYSGFRSGILFPAMMAMLFSLFFLFITYFGYSRIKGDTWYRMALLGVIVMNLTLKLGQGTRMVLYFSQAQAVFLPRHLKSSRNLTNRRIVKCVYYLYLFVNFSRILLDQWDTLTPYMFFWQI